MNIISIDLPWKEDKKGHRALEQNLKGMEDSIEGPKAFREKRRPIFKNR